jgi:hypothetical protein
LVLPFCAVTVSWLASFAWRHGVEVTGWHQYSLVADRGRVEARYGARTDVAYAADGTASVHEVSFWRGAGAADIRWYAPEPLMRGSSLARPWFRTGFGFKGGEVPIPVRSGSHIVSFNYREFGERTTAWSVPHWMAATVAAFPAAFWVTGVYRRHRRASSGRCAACGYDLRATPDRCPECGREQAATPPHHPPVQRPDPAG